MKNRMRLTFKCWSCSKTYQLTREISGNPRVIIDCPYCSKRGVYDFNLYRDTKSEILRGSDIDLERETLNLPAIIETYEPTEEELS
ncbi:hypothetical protein [Teredinibacter turnerae]|uniref:hypothetical protein n=1 Tax=Teredinibacter turnerae TaxID=2426 RepID=UPI00036D8110|nr:hypothetical protein [Teredinibacter turnerae]